MPNKHELFNLSEEDLFDLSNFPFDQINSLLSIK
jgi:hypothetical protein